MRHLLLRSRCHILAAAILAVPSAARAAILYWDGTGINWQAATAWSTVGTGATPDPAAAPGAADIAIFSTNTVASSQAITINSPVAASQINFSTAFITTLNSIGVGSITLGSGGIVTNSSAGVAAINALIKLAAASPVTGNGSILLGGPIDASAGPLAMTAAGTLTLANTYTGNITVTTGTLQLGNNTSTGIVTGNITNNATLIFNRSAAAVYNGVITGSGAFFQNGSSGLTLAAPSTYTGDTTVNNGSLFTLGTDYLPITTNLILNNNGVFGPGGAGQTVRSLSGAGGAVSISGPQTFTLNQSANTTYAGAIYDATSIGAPDNANFLKQGAGTLTLTGDSNSLGGTVTIAAGALQLGNNGSSGNFSAKIANNATLIFNRSNDATFRGVISGSGTLIKTGNGLLTLSAPSTYTGDTIISQGVIATTGTNYLPVTTNLILTSNFGPGGAGQTVASISGTGDVGMYGGQTLTVNQSSNTTYAGSLYDGTTYGSPSDLANFVKQGSGTLTLTSDGNSLGGGVTIAAGALQLGNNTDAGNFAASITNNATLIFNRSNNFAFTGVISGSGTLIKTGTSALLLTSPASYTGDTIINQGTILTAGTDYLPVSTNLVTNGGFFSPSGAGQTLASLSGTGGGIGMTGNMTLTLNQSANTTYTGLIYDTKLFGLSSDTANLLKQGSGTLTLNKAPVIGGNITVSGGTIKFGVHAALGSSVVVVNGAGALDFNGDINIANPISVQGGGPTGDAALLNSSATDAQSIGTISLTGNAAIGGSHDIYLYGPVLGSNHFLIKNGPNTLGIFGNDDNAAMGLVVNAGNVGFAKTTGAAVYSVGGPGLVLNGGYVLFYGSSNNQIYPGSPLTINGGTLDLNGRNQQSPYLNGTGGTFTNNATSSSTLTLGNSSGITGAYAGIITGPLALTKLGTAAQFLSGANTFTGALQVQGGVLKFTNTQKLGPASISSGTLFFSGNVSDTLAGITATGGTLQIDAGTTLTSDAVTFAANAFWSITGTHILRSSASGGAYATHVLGHDATPLSGTSKVYSLSPGPGGTLDLKNNGLIVEANGSNNAPLIQQIAAYVASGAITSSTAATDPRYGVVVANNADLGLTNFGGLPVDANSILVTQALLGDANLDGVVNPTDLLIWAHNFNNTGSYSVASGDLNNDGVVNPTDLLIWAHNFNNSTASGIPSASVAGALGDLGGLGGTATPVPEPATALLLMAPLILLRRRAMKPSSIDRP